MGSERSQKLTGWFWHWSIHFGTLNEISDRIKSLRPCCTWLISVISVNIPFDPHVLVFEINNVICTISLRHIRQRKHHYRSSDSTKTSATSLHRQAYFLWQLASSILLEQDDKIKSRHKPFLLFFFSLQLLLPLWSLVILCVCVSVLCVCVETEPAVIFRVFSISIVLYRHDRKTFVFR